ncbi:transmembrane emp24 domain-containing protein p24delta4-like [Pyrus x bretschneideri]|uniref:transmembrane emp24 domain-containing protein p24delta4-like n=1 Tax=Pyrus x bretschneideri TaxID=225117 RepID=UPI002030D40E|nr:transmembrane emp24 domain-containing protein p24delta4-like [Pyrus x bretschneideri]
MPTRTSVTALAAALLLTACSVVPTSEAIWMKLPSSDTKCVSEEIQNNVVFLGDYGVISHDHNRYSTISVKHCLLKRKQIPVHQAANAHCTGRMQQMVSLPSQTQESGTYLACFSVDGNKHEDSSVSLDLDRKIGVAAQDWDSVARKDRED